MLHSDFSKKSLIMPNFSREVSKTDGSLCSLAFMHLALTDSIKTESQMTNLSYDTMKEAIVEEIMKVKNLNSSTYDANQKDEIHLKMFKQGEF